MTTPDSHRQLIERARRGERAAFDQLFAEHADRVEYFVRLRVGDRLRGFVEIDDILQEAALRAWRSLERFRWRREESFLRWLQGIAGHVVLENASRCARRMAAPLQDEGISTGPSQETLARREERFARLQAAFDGLSRDHRRVILLARLEKLPLAVVAGRMSRSEAATKQLLWRALQQLRARFGETESLRLPDRPLAGRGDDDD